MKLLITISYLGSRFCGYQIQKDSPTIQAELNRAAKEIFGFDCDITGCSRTDSGVHANAFYATVNKKGDAGIETRISCERIPQAFCAHLPDDISVYDAKWVQDDFHPRYDVKGKEYIYRIYNNKIKSPFECGRSYHYPRYIDDEALVNMQKAASLFVGEKDFSSFMAQGSSVESTVRCVKYANVERQGDLVVFTVCSNGFLYNMVRIMAGTLISVAEGKISAGDIPKIIEERERSRAGMTAPACGLYLNKVFY